MNDLALATALGAVYPSSSTFSLILRRLTPPLAFTLSNTAWAPALVRLAGPLTPPVSALVVPIWIASEVTPGAVAPPLPDDEVGALPPHAAARRTVTAAVSGSLDERFISSLPGNEPLLSGSPAIT